MSRCWPSGFLSVEFRHLRVSFKKILQAWEEYGKILEVLRTYLLSLIFKQYNQNPKQALMTDFFYSALNQVVRSNYFIIVD